MKKEIFKKLAPYFVSFTLFILIDLIYFYVDNKRFSLEELKNAVRPAIATLALIIAYYLIRLKSKNAII